MILRIKNWTRFQHYRNRKPPWIKLHHDLLDDFEFHGLPDASRALAPMLWLLASESLDGSIDGTWDSIAFRLRSAPKAIEEACKPLIDKGFIESASTLLADCKQDATPETETEIETEAEREAKTGAQKPRSRKQAIPFPEGLELTPEMSAFASEHGIESVAEFAKFRDYHKAKGTTFRDWTAAFRNWVRNAVEFGKGVPAVTPTKRRTNELTEQARETYRQFGVSM